MAIKFFFKEISITIKERKRLKRCINELFMAEKMPILSLNYVFCSDELLLSINKEFLNHDYYTDIITFTLSDPQEPIIGEIYISVDRVRENGKLIGSGVSKELHRVIFHGALHLCGFKDQTSDEKKRMNEAEEKYLKEYFV